MSVPNVGDYVEAQIGGSMWRVLIAEVRRYNGEDLVAAHLREFKQGGVDWVPRRRDDPFYSESYTVYWNNRPYEIIEAGVGSVKILLEVT